MAHRGTESGRSATSSLSALHGRGRVALEAEQPGDPQPGVLASGVEREDPPVELGGLGVAPSLDLPVGFSKLSGYARHDISNGSGGTGRSGFRVAHGLPSPRAAPERY